MCGIIGVSVSSGKHYDLKNQLKSIAHRGPDDAGEFYSLNNDAQLGHVRLSIIDTSSAGHQPMYDSTGRYVMVYNGEVYNYLDLKNELEKKYGNILWNSTTDSEVILEGFVRENTSFFEKLNGIFSILIYDIQEQILHVLRDPIGIKPLYFTQQNGDIFFCSELKGLLQINELSRTIRIQSLSDQLAFMYVPEPFTMYNEFYKVERGVLYTYRYGKKITEKKLFLHLQHPLTFKSELEILECFQDTFSKSIKRQLISDVPVSLFLSGGLDSSAVAYEAVKNGANIHSAYTISYSKKDEQLDWQSPDLFYARMIAKQLHLDLNIIQAEPEFMNLLPELIPFMEDGISDPAAINTYLISKNARENGIKVMLSGQGADEYLCGYRRYIAEQYVENLNPILKHSLQIASNFLPNNLSGNLNTVVRRIKSLAKSSSKNQIERLSGYFMLSEPSNIQKLFKNPDSVFPGVDIIRFFESNTTLPTMQRLLAADQQFDLLALNLAYSDKMSMMVGVELRVPFLDFELVKLMNSLPANMKIKGNKQKYILKKIMEGKLPNEVIHRAKTGFALPIRSWFSKKNSFVDAYFDSKKFERQGLFDSKAILSLYQEQLSGKKDNSYILFSILCQQIWLEKYY